MHSDLHLHFTRATAGARRDETIRSLAPARAVAAPQSLETTLALRLAHADEGDVVGRLAALDSQPALAGPVLLALADGEPVAALALADGRIAADPFVASTGVIELLRLRAGLPA